MHCPRRVSAPSIKTPFDRNAGTYLNDLEQVLLRVPPPSDPDGKSLERSFPVVRLLQERRSFSGSDGGETFVDRRATHCDAGHQGEPSPTLAALSLGNAPMAKASVARSKGAVWKGVSKTPSTGAKRMSQKMRANCAWRARQRSPATGKAKRDPRSSSERRSRNESCRHVRLVMVS